MSDPFSTPKDQGQAAAKGPEPEAMANALPTFQHRPAAPPRPAQPVAEATEPVAPQPPPPPPPAPPPMAPVSPMPSEFVFDTEHPILPVPFKAQIGDNRLEGVELSVAAAYVAISGALDPAWKGHKEVIKLTFDFQGFSVVLYPEVVVAGSRHDGEMTLQFLNPTGPHLPQLRYIINSFIAGDYISLGGMLSYTGPTQPKASKNGTKSPSRLRMRSAAIAVMSLSLIVATLGTVINRLTQSYELRPVFIERLGNEMKATTAGQITFLNPMAKKGEVVFSINANSGDVLNFQLPCDCEVTVTQGVFAGSTVLPIDSILTFFDTNAGVRMQSQLSIEGLAKVMSGEQAFLDVNDGRSIPVEVVLTSATNAAAMRGDEFVPVNLQPKVGAVTNNDIGKIARIRLSRPWFGARFLNPSE